MKQIFLEKPTDWLLSETARCTFGFNETPTYKRGKTQSLLTGFKVRRGKTVGMLGGWLAQRQAALRGLMAAGTRSTFRMFRACRSFLSTFCAREKIFLEKRTD